MRSEWAEDPSVKAWHEMELKRRIENLERPSITYYSHGGVKNYFCRQQGDQWIDPDTGVACDLPHPDSGDVFEDAVNAVLDEMRETMLKKQADYGPNNIARAPGGPINGLRVRMFDKLSRISNLHESGAEAENEPLRDSFLDLACYGLIGLMVLDGTWPNLES